jgi:thiamine biosynthesis lipoprotein
MLNVNIPSPLLVVHRRLVRLLNNSFEISVVANDKQWAEEKIDNAAVEISRVLKLLSVTNEDSQINQINQYAGIHPVKVDQEIFSLLNRSLKVSDLTQGAFDITYNSIDSSFWNKDNNAALPDTETAKKAVRLIDYRNVILNAKTNSVFLKEKGMRIDLSPIANGYASDRAKYLLQMQGVSSGIVNAFGDLITWGRQPNNEPWTIAAADPDQKLEAFSGLNISNMAVSTSGPNQNFSVIDGKKYEHAVNPKTGFPLRSIKSVSILGPSAEFAAAMAAPVKVMGVKLSLNLFNRLNQLVCVIVNDRKKVYTSKSIHMVMCEA